MNNKMEFKKKLISIVIPVYNEQDNIENCYKRLNQIASSIPAYDFEFLFTDNCSKDNSYAILNQLATVDKRVKAYSFSKNFGYQYSIYTGLIKTQGDAAIVFDCDLQDPPELLPTFIEKWEEGNKVVYGIRKKRDENFIVEWMRKLFYRGLNYLSEDKPPLDAGDFRLIDRVIIEILRETSEHDIYIRGIVSSVGFKQLGIPYYRNKRVAGESKFGFYKMIGLAVDAVLSQSMLPLRLAFYVGIFVALITFILMCGYLIASIIFFDSWPRGFSTTTILILFSLSMNALFLGIIGEYLALILKQVRNRPLTIIEKSTDESFSNLVTKHSRVQDKSNPISADNHNLVV